LFDSVVVFLTLFLKITLSSNPESIQMYLSEHTKYVMCVHDICKKGKITFFALMWHLPPILTPCNGTS